MERDSNIIGIRVGVYGVVPTEDHILLVEKGRGPYTGQWGLPGGGMDPGETPLETLKREMLEETRLKLLPEPKLFTTMSTVVSLDDPPDSKIQLLGIAFPIALDRREPVRVEKEGEDVTACEWHALKDLDRLEISAYSGQAIHKYLKEERGIEWNYRAASGP